MGKATLPRPPLLRSVWHLGGGEGGREGERGMRKRTQQFACFKVCMYGCMGVWVLTTPDGSTGSHMNRPPHCSEVG